MKLIRISKSARFYKGKTAKYAGEVIYRNGRHAVCAVIMNGGKHDSHGGFLVEFALSEVEFLFPVEDREVVTLLAV